MQGHPSPFSKMYKYLRPAETDIASTKEEESIFVLTAIEILLEKISRVSKQVSIGSFFRHLY